MNFDSFSPTDKQPLYSQIRDWLLGELAEYSLEAKLPTDRELARGLGVAPLTVKRVMGDLERDGYVVRHQGRGTFLASRERRVHPDGQRANENGEVIIAYPNYFSYEYWARAHHAESLALKAGLGLVEFKMNPSTTYEALFALVGRREDARGLMIAPVPGSIDRAVFDKLDALGLPVVIFAHCGHLSLGQHIYTVTPDWMKMGYMQVGYLLDHGHESLAYLANEPGGQDGGERLRGMRQCMKDRGMPARSLRCLRGNVKPWESSVTSAYRLCSQLCDFPSVSAVVVDSVAGAMGVLRYCAEHGIAMPGELSIISSGPSKPFDQYVFPDIVSIYSPYDVQVEQAFDIIMRPDRTGSRSHHAPVVVEAGASVADLNSHAILSS